jgi:hypothetical protein
LVYQIGGCRLYSVYVIRPPPKIEANGASFYPPKVGEALLKRSDTHLYFRICLVIAGDHTDASHLLGLLRPSGERPRRCRTTEKRDELAPPHVRSQAQVTAS